MNSNTTNELENYLELIEHDSHKIQKFYENKSEEINHQLLGRYGKEGLITLKKEHQNKTLEELLRSEGRWEDKIIHSEGQLVRQSDPVFNSDIINSSWLDYRTHFFSPEKHFAGIIFDTFYFNICVIWLMVFALFLSLYFNILKKLLGLSLKIKSNK